MPLLIARNIVAMGAGERSDLRRGKEGAAFWRLWNQVGLEERDAPVEMWKRLIMAIANLIGTGSHAADSAGIHNPKVGLGVAMFRSDIKSSDLNRMFAATREIRLDIVDRILLRIAKNAPRLNIFELAELYLSDEITLVARNIARDYYSHEYKAQKSQKACA